jgi:hypothetical protein
MGKGSEQTYGSQSIASQSLSEQICADAAQRSRRNVKGAWRFAYEIKPVESSEEAKRSNDGGPDLN